MSNVIGEFVKLNKSNWTGEDATLFFKRDGQEWSWEQLGYDIQLTTIQTGHGYVSYDLTVDGQSLGHRVVSAGSSWVAHSGDVSRENAHPAVAAAQLLYNTL